MNSISTDNQAVRLNEVLKQLKNVIAKAEFLMTKDTLTRQDKLIVKVSNLLTGQSSHYFCPEAKLYLSSVYISKADVQRIMERRGEKLSRSGLEGRLFSSAKQFVLDFGPDAIAILVADRLTNEQLIRLDAIELTLLKITAGIDYTDNNVDRLLKSNGLNIESIKGFSSVDGITQEQIDRIVELLEPYTERGKAKRVEELSRLSHVLWHFRKACLDGSDDATVNYILRSIS